MRTRFTRAMTLVAPVAMVAWMAGGMAGSAEATTPSGQVMYGHTTFDASTGQFVGGGGTIEPAYDDSTGTLVYLQTPTNAKVNPPGPIDPTTGLPVNVAPLYLPVYPAGSGIDPATLNCAHVPADNCPDHGPLVAGGTQGAAAAYAAATHTTDLYAGGVLGHDHLVGIPSTGGDFNMIWEPVLVVFTDLAAAEAHPTLLSTIQADVNGGKAFEIPLPQLDFNCARVSAAAYARGTAP